MHSFPGFLGLALVAGALTATAVSGCGCTKEGNSGLAIFVRDARTRALICDAHIAVDEGDYKEEGNPPPALAGPCGYHGAYDRPGNYHIVVSRPGFLTKELNDVEVEKDGCHVDGRTLDVDLERDPNAPPELDAGADASTDGP